MNYKFASSYAYSQIYQRRTKLQKLSYSHIYQNKNRSCICNEMLNPVTCFYKHSSHSDSVTRVSDSTRVTTFGDSDSTRATLRKMVTRLDPSHIFHRMIRLDSQSMTRDSSQSYFTKSLSPWQTNLLRVHLKIWAFLSSVVIKIGANFLFCLSSRSMLHFKDQASQLAQR